VPTVSGPRSIDPDLEVVVAFATYQRPELVRTLLPLVMDQAKGLPCRARVVVVDNDPDASARPVVEAVGSEDVDYHHEPRPGIAAARNRALDEADTADVIVFLDDDEEPETGWLETLVEAWTAWQCAGVSGPVVSHFDGPVDPWVSTCSTFRRPRRTSGTRVEGAATNNLLLDLHQLRRHDVRFDDRFGLTGGSDTMLTRTLIRRGGEIRWCDEALMHETVPAERATRSWALRRTRRTGNVWSRVQLALAESPTGRLRTKLSLTARGCYRLLAGVLAVLAAWATRDLARRSDGELELAKGLGVLGGAWGHQVTEYRREESPARR
jgi:succinoglycan biosynthesis protein ExoM